MKFPVEQTTLKLTMEIQPSFSAATPPLDIFSFIRELDFEIFAPNFCTWVTSWSLYTNGQKLQLNMDVADRTTGTVHVRDELAERAQKLFQDFLEE